MTIPDTLCAETIPSVIDHVDLHIRKGKASDCRPNNEVPLSSCSYKLTTRKPVIEAKPLTASSSMTVVRPLTISSPSPNDAEHSTVISSLIESKPLRVSTPLSTREKSMTVVSSPKSTTTVSPISSTEALSSLTNAKQSPCLDGNSPYPLLNAASTPMFESVLDESLAGFLSIRFKKLRVSSRSSAGRSSSLNSHSSSCLAEGNFPIGAEMCLRQRNDTQIGLPTKPLSCNGSPIRPSAFLGRVDLWKESFEPS